MKTAARAKTKKESQGKNNFALTTERIKSLLPSAKTSFVAVASGAVLGLSCPGFEQWYIAWFGLAPFFLLLASAKNHIQRTALGFLFAMAFNLVYLHWYLNLAPLDWLGFPGLMSNLLATTAWLYSAAHTSMPMVAFALIAGFLPPLKAPFWQKKKPTFHWSMLFIWPLIYVVVNKLGNAPVLMGVPWSQLEYTQYKQTSLLQAASICGGIGIGYLIAVVNCALASLVATILSLLAKKTQFKVIAAASVEVAYYQCLGVALFVGAFICVGMWQKDEAKIAANYPIAIAQPAINIDMQKGQHSYTLADLTAIYDKLLNPCKDELCILTEGALPTYLRNEQATRQWLARAARSKHLDLVVGSLDKDATERPYNAAYGITSSGTIFDEVYHKRFLVPYGEYTPLLIQYAPEWVKRWTNTPAGGGFAAGREAVAYKFDLGKVAPLICFECISPEQAAASARNGGEVFVNISDLAWFHESDCGRQMVAFSVMRAIENRRYFVFGANTGPAAIIDCTGNITKYSPQGGATLIQGKFGLNSKHTFFMDICR